MTLVSQEYFLTYRPYIFVTNCWRSIRVFELAVSRKCSIIFLMRTVIFARQACSSGWVSWRSVQWWLSLWPTDESPCICCNTSSRCRLGVSLKYHKCPTFSDASPSSGWSARDRRRFARDLTVLFVLVSASIGSKLLKLPLTVTVEQTKKGPITSGNEMKEWMEWDVMELWQSCQLTTDWRHTGDTGSPGSSEVLQLPLPQIFGIATEKENKVDVDAKIMKTFYRNGQRQE